MMEDVTLTVPVQDAAPLRELLLLRYTGTAEALGLRVNHEAPDGGVDALAGRDELRRWETLLDAVGWSAGALSGEVAITMPADELRELLVEGFRGAAEALDGGPPWDPEDAHRRLEYLTFFAGQLDHTGWPATTANGDDQQ